VFSTCDNFALSLGQKQVDCVITLPPFSTLSAGTCSNAFTGALCTGTTLVRILNSAGITVAASPLDGTCGGCGVIPGFVNKRSVPTNFTMRQSCSPIGAVTCSAVTKLVVLQAPAPPPPLPPAPQSPTSPQLVGTGACEPFAISRGQKYVDCVINVPAGKTVYAGGCGISGGASCYGDTRLLLLASFGRTMVSNDNGTVDGCGACSLVQYTNTGYFSANYVLRQHCMPLKNGVCGGTSAYAIVAPGGVTPYAARSLIDFGSGSDSNTAPALGGNAVSVVAGNSPPNPTNTNNRRTLIVLVVAIASSLSLLCLIVACPTTRSRPSASRAARARSLALTGARARWRKKRDGSPESFKIVL
jgi:hypothetical protein